MTIQQALQLALEHHRANRLPAAEQIYRQILAQVPDQGESAFYLALILKQTGRATEAAALLARCVAIDATVAEARLVLADTLLDLHRDAEAIEHYRAALAQQPDKVEAWLNLSFACQRIGRNDLALDACREAIRLRPDMAAAHTNLAESCRIAGLLDDALRHAAEAVRLQPDLAHAWFALGNAQLAAGRAAEAAAAFESALRLQPDFADALNNLGVARIDTGENDAARKALEQAVKLRPVDPNARTNLARVLERAGQLDEALSIARQVVQQHPNHAEGWNQLGIILARLHRPQEATDAFRSATRARPGLADAHNNIGNALKDQARVEEAIDAYRQTLKIDPRHAAAWSNLLYTLHFLPAITGETLLSEHIAWARQQTDRLLPASRPFANRRTTDRRLRVGYVSADLRRHAVGTFLLPLLAHHDRDRFEICCYADVTSPDSMTELLRAHADHWRFTAHLSHAALAEQIRADEVDILVDLSLHAAGSRMLTFARKPAPVQMTYLGYPGTTGLSSMDWRLTDRMLDPADERGRFYSERSAHLETTYWCYRPPDVDVAPGEPPLLRCGHVTFGCFNNFVKSSDAALAAWGEILARLSGSRLILHADPGAHRDRAIEVFAARGIGADRIEFAARTPLAEYLASYNRIDVALDPFPYCGATTTFDALWMGVPVVSLVGDIAVRRTGLSILSRVGLADLAVENVDRYIETAAALAGDVDRLRSLRRELRERMKASPLMDAPAFARDVERLYRMMWDEWRAADRG